MTLKGRVSNFKAILVGVIRNLVSILDIVFNIEGAKTAARFLAIY